MNATRSFTVAVRILALSLTTVVIAGEPNEKESGVEHTRMRFADIAVECGVDFTMTCGKMPSREILEVDGGGVALIDYDNDGDFDLFFANGATMDDPEHGPGSRLYENKLESGVLRFEDATQRLGIDVKRWAMGVAVGDYDGDGFDDLYVTCYGPNLLLRNDGGKRFIDVTEKADVGDPHWSTSAAFGDIDGDGDLDLYVANYLEFNVKKPPSRENKLYKGVNVMAGPQGLTAQADVLYENRGDGTFADISESSGIRSVTPGYGLVAQMFDYDNDGRQDIFVGNDSTENFLFHNKGGGKFENVGVISGIATNLDGAAQATMGIALGDVDGNGRPDVFTTAFSSDTNTLHLNLDGVFFEDRTSRYRLGSASRRFLSWACGFYDFDSDGDEDLLITNGHVYPEAATHDIDSEYEQPLLLLERRDKRFERVADAGDITMTPMRGRTAAFGDLDGDGDVDVVLTTLNDKSRILRNDAPPADAIVVDLQLTGPNHRGYGSVVDLIAGETKQRRWITGGGSFQSTNAPAAYFGIGRKPVESLKIEVRAPDGKTIRIDDVTANRRITITPGGQRTSVLRWRE